MRQNRERQFDFSSSALARDAFEVVSFTGREALSACYAFDVVLLSRQDAIDADSVIGEGAVLTLHGQEGAFSYHGLVCVFEQTGKVGEFTFYRARLVPRPHLLTLVENCRLFLDMPVNAFLEDVLRQEGLTAGVDFEFRLTKAYPRRPQVSQFRETAYAFVSRWMEHDGLYFFFEQGPSGAKMVITDARTSHQPLPGKSELRYETPSGLATPRNEEGVFAFKRCLQPVPQSVLLKDWNYETPSVDLAVSAPVLAEGHGASHQFGDHFRTIDEGRDLAAIRAQELLCRRDTAEGETAFPGLTAGRLLRLTHHFQDGCNREYLVTSVRHQGRQFDFLTAGLGLAHEPDGEAETFYRNGFTAIPAEVQFRPERKTPWPRQEGLVSAVIDGAGSGKYPEVDDQGRYKIKLAYDRCDRKDGKASTWVRLAQPYGGADHGLHFPLHKGCEVVLACLDGDPDRPVILGAVPNPDHKSVVTNANQTRTNLETSGANQLYFEDMEGSKRALMQSKSTQTFLRLGTPNDPATSVDYGKNNGASGIAITSPHGLSVVVGSMLSTYLIAFLQTLGFLQVTYAGVQETINVGASQEIDLYTSKTLYRECKIGCISNKLQAEDDQIAINKLQMTDMVIASKRKIDAIDTKLQTLRDTLSTLAGEVNGLYGDVNSACRDKDEMSANVSRLTEQRSRLAQHIATQSGTAQELAKTKTKLTTKVNSMAALATRVSDEIREVSGQRTETIGEYRKTAAEISSMSDLDVTI